MTITKQRLQSLYYKLTMHTNDSTMVSGYDFFHNADKYTKPSTNYNDSANNISIKTTKQVIRQYDKYKSDNTASNIIANLMCENLYN